MFLIWKAVITTIILAIPQGKVDLTISGDYASSEYNFFLVLFALVQRESKFQQGDLSFRFANQVYEKAKSSLVRKAGKIRVHHLDRIINDQSIDWSLVNNTFKGYEGVLSAVNVMVEEITSNSTMSEVSRLLIFAKMVVHYKSKDLKPGDNQVRIKENWMNIAGNLAELLTNKAIPQSSTEPPVTLFFYENHNGHCILIFHLFHLSHFSISIFL